MPWGDRTGPLGYGSRTGRGLGYCSGYSSPGFTKGPGMGMGWGGGRGWGGGWGRGRGWGYFGRGGWGIPPRYYPQIPPEGAPYPEGPWVPQMKPEDEAKYLESALTGLKKEIEEIENRLLELKREKEK